MTNSPTIVEEVALPRVPPPAKDSIPNRLKPVMAADLAATVEWCLREIDTHKKKYAATRPSSIAYLDGCSYMSLPIFNRLCDLCRYHGVWSIHVLAKYVDLDPASLYNYVHKYPQAKEMFDVAREEFRVYLSQGVLTRIFDLLDNPRADAKAKALLLTKLLEKSHPDFKDKVVTSAKELENTGEDRQIVVTIRDHSKTGAPAVEERPVAVVFGAPPQPLPHDCPLPPINTTILSDDEVEKRAQDATRLGNALGENLFLPKKVKK